MTEHVSAGGSARRTRRQLLTAGTGALAAVLTAEALARPAPAAATDGNPVILGTDNTTTNGTSITNDLPGNNAFALEGAAYGATTAVGLSGVSDSGTGVSGAATSGDGVHGFSTSGNGVFGASGTGVGVSGTCAGGLGVGVTGNGGDTGVRGTGGSFGVQGSTITGAGFGVTGVATAATGVGVVAENSGGGNALLVSGKAAFSRSGVLTVAAGKSSATQTGVALTKASLLLATLQQDRAGVWVRSAVPKVTANSFTVHLSKPVPARTTVAWFVVN